jgi:hypothetical protein
MCFFVERCLWKSLDDRAEKSHLSQKNFSKNFTMTTLPLFYDYILPPKNPRKNHQKFTVSFFGAFFSFCDDHRHSPFFHFFTKLFFEKSIFAKKFLAKNGFFHFDV